MVTCLFFSGTARQQGNNYGDKDYESVKWFHFISKNKLTAITIMMIIDVCFTLIFILYHNFVA